MIPSVMDNKNKIRIFLSLSENIQQVGKISVKGILETNAKTAQG